MFYRRFVELCLWFDCHDSLNLKFQLWCCQRSNSYQRSCRLMAIQKALESVDMNRANAEIYDSLLASPFRVLNSLGMVNEDSVQTDHNRQCSTLA